MLAARAQAAGQPPPPPFQPPPQLQAMLGQPTWQDVMGLLRDNTLRAFRIDIETDSTIEPNDQDEKQRRVEFITAVGDYVSKSIPAVQMMPPLLPVIAEGLKFLVRGFRVGREMEDTIDKALDQLSQGAAAGAAAGGHAQGAPPKAPDPQVEQVKAQASMTTAQARVMDAQTNARRAQTDAFAAQAGAQIEGQRIALESQHQRLDHAADFALHREQMAQDMRQAADQGVRLGPAPGTINPASIPPPIP